MGVVYEAEQQQPRRPVALKVIRGGTFVTPQRVKLFEREAQALARLKHPGIAAIYEAGRTPDGQHFFAMELVRGETLGVYAQRRRRTNSEGSRELLPLFRRMCDAVNYAHQRGVIHRDLKPANVMVTGDASASRTGFRTTEIKVLDFGLARITEADPAGGTFLTEAGRVQGTLAYMSPEQVRGNPDEIDIRTDVYSLGVILYELVTGSPPYDVAGMPPHEAAHVILERDPTPLGKGFGRQIDGVKRLSRDLEAILMKALEKEPRRRYQSAAALAEDVEHFLQDEPISARAPSTTYQIRKLVARHKATVGCACALVLLLTTFAGVMTVQTARLARERDRARLEAETARRVTDFMVDLFNVSDPGESRGTSITAREVLDRGVTRLGTELTKDTAIQARLQNTIGRVYTRLGLYRDARPLLEAALAEYRTHFGASSLEAAQALFDLAELANDSDHFANEADAKTKERWSRESLTIRRERLGNDHLDVAASLRQVGVAIADASGDKDGEGERLLQESLAIRKRRVGSEHPLVADSLGFLGVVISYVKSDFARGEPYLRDALEMRRRLLGVDHPDTLFSILALANHFNRKGDLASAEPLHREVIAIGKKTLGPTHPVIAGQMNELLIVLGRKGDFEAADRIGHEALAIADTKYPDIARAITVNLATNRRSMNDRAGAEALLRRLLDGNAADRPLTGRGWALNQLAALLNEQGNYQEALRRADEAIAILRNGGSRADLGEALYHRGNALRHFDTSRAERAYGEGSEVQRIRIATLKARFPSGRSIADAESLLGGCLAGLGQYEEAEPLLVRSYVFIRQFFGEGHVRTREARERIVRLYQDWGRSEKAAEYRTQSAAARLTHGASD